MDTNEQSNEQTNLRDKFSKAREACQSLVKEVWQYKLGLGWIVVITALFVGLSVPLNRYFLNGYFIDNNKLQNKVKFEVNNFAKENNIDKNNKETIQLIKPELHDWVKGEVKDSVSGLTSSTNFVLSFLALLPILYGLAFYLFQNGLIQKAVSDGSTDLKEKMKNNVKEQTQDFTKKLDQYKAETENVKKQFTEKYKLGLTRQIKIILSSIKIERLSSQQKADISNQDLEDLLRELEKLLKELEQDKDNSALVTTRDYVLLGDAYYANKQYDKAKQTHQKALNYEETLNAKYNNSGNLLSEICYKIGNNLAENNQLEDARKEYKKIDKNNSNYIWALHYWGFTYHKEFKYKDAIVKYDDAIRIEKKNYNYEALYQTLYYKAISLAGLQKYEKAIDCYKKALIIEQHFNWLWHSYGDALRELHRHEEAIEKYNKALECNYLSAKNRAETVSRLGNTYSNLARDTKDKEKQKEYYDQALQYYEYSLMLDPENGTSLYGKGEVHNARHEYDEACKKYRENIDILSEDNTSSRLALNYAYVLEKSGEQNKANSWYIKAFDKAKKDLKELESLLKDQLVEDPHKYWYSYYNMACYHALHQDIDQACHFLNKAMKIERETGDTEQIKALNKEIKALNKIFKELVKRWARIDLEFDLIREDQRFKDVLEG